MPDRRHMLRERSVALRMRFGKMRTDFFCQFLQWQLRMDAPELAYGKTLTIFLHEIDTDRIHVSGYNYYCLSVLLMGIRLLQCPVSCILGSGIFICDVAWYTIRSLS